MILVEVSIDNYYKLINKLISLNINISNIEYRSNKIVFIIKYEEYLKIKKYVKTYDFKIIKRYGINNIKDIFNKYKIFIVSIIIGFIMFIILSNVIVDVKIISSDKELVKLIDSELHYHNIKRLTFKKSFNELESIKNKIINNNKERIEWLSIKIDGMNYVINVEERIINKNVEKSDKCHVIASKSGIIKSISNSKGVNNVFINDYVEKDSILISGIVKKDEEIKSYVCASGEVYAEVWYKVNVKVPLYYEEVKTTNKVRYNIKINDYLVFKSRLSNSYKENIRIISVFNNTLYLVKESGIITNINKYNEEELNDKMDELLNDKFDIKLKDNEYIINKSIINSRTNDKYLESEVFVSVNENISKSITFVIEE